jgi:tellurite resistance protein TehA-like permease
VGIFFLYVGFSKLETTTVRQMTGGLGVLLVAVNGIVILASWLLPTEYLHGPIEVTSLIVGFTSILAARYLADQRSRRRGRAS